MTLNFFDHDECNYLSMKYLFNTCVDKNVINFNTLLIKIYELISFDNVSSMSIRGKSTVNGSSFINSDVIFAVVIFLKISSLFARSCIYIINNNYQLPILSIII